MVYGLEGVRDKQIAIKINILNVVMDKGILKVYYPVKQKQLHLAQR